MPALPWTQVLGGQLVGRAREFGRLLASLDQAADGQPIVALVSGDAGVGKARLVAELTLRAGERGIIVLSGRCAGPSPPLGRTPPAAQPVQVRLLRRTRRP